MSYQDSGLEDFLCLISRWESTDEVTADSEPLEQGHEAFLKETFCLFENVMEHLKDMWDLYRSTCDVNIYDEAEYFEIARHYNSLLYRNDQEIETCPSPLGYVDYDVHMPAYMFTRRED